MVFPLFFIISGVQTRKPSQPYRVMTYTTDITWSPVDKGVFITHLILYIITFIPRIVWCLLCVDVLIKMAK
jgi:hypothetical protein